MSNDFTPWPGCMGEVMGEDTVHQLMDIPYWLANRLISPFSLGRHLFVVTTGERIVEALADGVQINSLGNYYGQKVRFLWPKNATIDDGLMAAKNAQMMVGQKYDYSLWLWLAITVIPRWLSHPMRKCLPQELPEDRNRNYLCYEVGGKAWNPVPDTCHQWHPVSYDLTPYAPDIPHSIQQSIESGRLLVIGTWP